MRGRCGRDSTLAGGTTSSETIRCGRCSAAHTRCARNLSWFAGWLWGRVISPHGCAATSAPSRAPSCRSAIKNSCTAWSKCSGVFFAWFVAGGPKNPRDRSTDADPLSMVPHQPKTIEAKDEIPGAIPPPSASAGSRSVLIVNADDWGWDRETTDRTLNCFLEGSLSSVSAMVFMQDSERAARLARQHGIDAGLH